MKILFIVPSYKPAYIYGGTIVVVTRLAEQLILEGHDVSVYTTTANGKTELDVIPGKETDVDGVKVTYFKRITHDHTHVSTALWKHLYSTVKEFDVVHIHSWWNLLVIGASYICKLRGVKPVFSPHGMLSTYIMETNNAGPKKLLHNVIGKGLLEHSILHVTAETEWEESIKINPHWRGHVIPNLVMLSENTYPRPNNKIFTIGFISRIDPKKGLDLLIKALSKVNFEYHLQIAGEGEENYVNSLKQLAVECGNDQKLEWVGWKNGEEKFEYLSQLDLFALTSHNENFAVVVIEALSVGTPVLLSDKVGLYKYVLDRDMGWITDLNVDNITQQLNTLYAEKSKLQKINVLAPAKIKAEYNDSVLAKEYLQLYINK
ncbi:Glycosyltransferase involved in cell wall bisynthesis [Pedobacter westerhofensis]|uniref:Glycosyltransferase involved in cell wall bisynthesis n=1 Tax=Pedobacter westerhofensis TaxID=425512 RepID=A0A521CA21_9SPHI|nr:glycosyltransferase [Pedobacter westerhofensis]SMO56246.1 Glycosyltransferase involved in cell wall bisynthesis [Pedobacter westerhofensis]